MTAKVVEGGADIAARPAGAAALAPGLRRPARFNGAQISTCVPSSITRFVGRLK